MSDGNVAKCIDRIRFNHIKGRILKMPLFLVSGEVRIERTEFFDYEIEAADEEEARILAEAEAQGEFAYIDQLYIDSVNLIEE